jgi:3-oxoacyl-[acyl-carrier protein] reductase
MIQPRRLNPLCANSGAEAELIVSRATVAQFARLTGDYSSLHTDPAFGRISAFRVNVAHGMLPVLFVLCPPILWKSGKKAKIKKLTATFLKPVFIDDKLRVVLEKEPDSLTACFAFRIVHSLSNMVVTTGSIELQYDDYSSAESGSYYRHSAEAEHNHESLLIEPLTERENINFEKGSGDSFSFGITPPGEELLCGILREGLIHHEKEFLPDQLFKHCDYVNLLTVLLCSTFAGMCVPGKNATFVDCQAEYLADIGRGKNYRFVGKINYHSVSTGMLLEDWQIVDDQSKGGVLTLARGKIKVRVNNQRRVMPTVDELKDRDMDLQLKDKVVLVTGASRGLGETIAKLLSLYHSKVVVNYNQGKEDALSIVRDIEQSGGRALALQADITNRHQVGEMVRAVVKKFGRVDILVNNAVRDTRPVSFLETTWDEVQKDIDVTLKGAFYCCQEVIPGMIQNKSGKIINISTIFADAPPPNQAKYVISKNALVGMTRSLAVELAPHNIQVNLVVPSLALTDLSNHVPKVFLEMMKNENPMKRHVTPGEVARAVVFLASSLSSFTTGQKIMVTGGQPPLL